MTTADQLFSDYNDYRLHTSHYKSMLAEKGFLKSPKRTPDRLNKFETLIGFCEENSMDPRLYLYSLFQARNWLFAPRWDHIVPGTKKTAKKAIARYRALKGVEKYSAKMQKERDAVDGTLYNPNRDTNPSVENLKRRHIDAMNTDRCMREMQTSTLGYHPRSLVCARCPAAKDCEQQLQASVPYDITALRLGKITLDQAQRLSGSRHGSR